MAELATNAPITNLSLRADRSRPRWLARVEAEGKTLLLQSARPALASRLGAGSAEARLATLQGLFRLELFGEESVPTCGAVVQPGGAARTGLCDELLPVEKPEQLWHNMLPWTLSAAPVGCASTVFFADYGGTSTEVPADSADGHGSHRVDGCIAMHLAASDFLLLASSPDEIFVRRRSDDELLWSTRHNSVGCDCNPACLGPMVVFAGQFRGLRACDLESGTQLWFGLAGSTVGAAALHEDGWGVACDLELKQVVAFGLDTGAELWRASLEGYGPIGPPVVTEGGMVLVQTDDGGLYGFDRGGRLAWHHSPSVFCSLPGRPKRQHRSLAAAAGVVVVGGPMGGIYGLDEEGGRALWRQSLGTVYEADPIVDGQHLLAADASGNCFCLDLHRGEPLWSVSIDSPATFSPLLHAGRLYLCGGLGQVTCLGRR